MRLQGGGAVTLGAMWGAGIFAARHALEEKACVARDQSLLAKASLKTGSHAKPRRCMALDQRGCCLMARRKASPVSHSPPRLAKETRWPSVVHGWSLSGWRRSVHSSWIPSIRSASGGSCTKRQATIASTTLSCKQCASAGLLGGAGERLRRRCAGRGDGDLEPGVEDLEYGEGRLIGLSDWSRTSGGGDLEALDGIRVRGDADLDLRHGRRAGKGELKGLGLLFAPGGARGWPVGQNSSEARELEPLLGKIGDQGSRSQTRDSGRTSES